MKFGLRIYGALIGLLLLIGVVLALFYAGESEAALPIGISVETAWTYIHARQVKRSADSRWSATADSIVWQRDYYLKPTRLIATRRVVHHLNSKGFLSGATANWTFKWAPPAPQPMVSRVYIVGTNIPSDEVLWSIIRQSGAGTNEIAAYRINRETISLPTSLPDKLKTGDVVVYTTEANHKKLAAHLKKLKWFQKQWDPLF